MVQRPVSVTAFGILNILLGAYGVLGGIRSAFRMFAASGQSNNPAMKVMSANQAYFVNWMRISIPAWLIVTALLLAAGIGLLLLKPWARWISLGCGFCAIVMSIAGPVIFYCLLLRPLMGERRGRSARNAMSFLFAVAAIIGIVLLALIYSGSLLYFMTRPHVIAAFRSSFGEVEAEASQA